jgi:hypothetical protein
MNILILGGGWYGCMIGLICLTYNIKFLILEKNDYLFEESSSNNQNRLHLGYHYPRSHDTIIECKKGYKKMFYLFKNFIDEIKYNLYAIEKDSKVNFDTYQKIYNILDDDIINKEIIKDKYNIDILVDKIEKIFKCNEKIIQHDKIKKLFNEILKNNYEKINEDKLVVNNDIILYNNITYDYFFNCTYGKSQIGFEDEQHDIYYELCLTFIYEHKNLEKNFAYTIMDGEFLSLYPYSNKENKSLFTLTHVKYTPIYKTHDIQLLETYKNSINHDIINEKKNIFESEIEKYIKSFKNEFKYYDYFLSVKCKFNASKNTDDRSLHCIDKNNRINFIGGKITGVIELINIIEKKIKLKIKYSDLKKKLK